MSPLSRAEILEAVRADPSLSLSTYRDIEASDRYSTGHSDNWRQEGEALDAQHGGDWMPIGQIGALNLIDDAFSGSQSA